ncbi:MAG: hypothetical protein HKO80_01585 [Flavobacteriaceae bacterium]|nr:hypothetical protein [Flavobacteriaceae bacterium]
MKNLIVYLCLTLCASTSISAQEQSAITINTSENYFDRSPIYDHDQIQLSNTDTIPDFQSKANKLKISGTIYQSDGITPAKDVILYIEQADELGDFDLRKHNGKRYVHHRGWIKTDANGHYTFYTFVPGNDRRYNQLQQLFPVIKEPNKAEYKMASFLFDEDPLLSKLCRKRMVKNNDTDRILKPETKDGLLVVQKDIVLSAGSEDTK